MDKTQAYSETLATLRRDLLEAETRVRQLREAIGVIERLVDPQAGFFDAVGLDQLSRQRKSPSRNGLSGLTMIDAALKVLAGAGRPMHIMDMVREMRERGFKYDNSDGALRASLTGSIEPKSEFQRVAPATYGLTVWTTTAEKKAGAAE